MVHRARIGLLLAVAISMLLVGAAFAERLATRKERRAIAKVMGLPTHCARIRISTVTERPTWASLYWKPGQGCRRYAADGVVVLKRKGQPPRWRMVTAGSDFDCPALYKDVPKRVARDLAIPCHAPL